MEEPPRGGPEEVRRDLVDRRTIDPGTALEVDLRGPEGPEAREDSKSGLRRDGYLRPRSGPKREYDGDRPRERALDRERLLSRRPALADEVEGPGLPELGLPRLLGWRPIEELLELGSSLSSRRVYGFDPLGEDERRLSRLCRGLGERLEVVDLSRGVTFSGVRGQLSLTQACGRFGWTIRKDKSVTMSDWRRRPLGDPQRRYAIGDAAMTLFLAFELGRIKEGSFSFPDGCKSISESESGAWEEFFRIYEVGPREASCLFRSGEGPLSFDSEWVRGELVGADLLQFGLEHEGRPTVVLVWIPEVRTETI